MDKPKFYITTAIAYTSRKPQNAKELELSYTDPEWILERSLDTFEKTYYGGDALPIIFPYWGCGG
mgnify:CR=1 FL=1